MDVRVKLYSTLRHYLPALKAGEFYRASVPPGATVGELLISLGVPMDNTKQAFVNGEAAPLDQVLREDDEVSVFPPVAGGQGDTGDERILAIDVGAGTQDILLYEPGVPMENCIQLILPSPTVILARRVREATAARRPVFLSGNLMGGGAVSWAVREHLAADLPVYATPAAAATLHDDPEKVRQMGVILEEAPPKMAVSLALHDVDLRSLAMALAPFDITLPSKLAVAVQDHGYSPRGSNRIFRLEHWRQFVEAGGDIRGLLYDRPPSHLTRMLAVQQDAPGAFVMDTGAAAVWGALCDDEVRARQQDGFIAINVGNAHTLAALVRGHQVLGLWEHHTGAMTPAKFVDYVERLLLGTLTHEEVFADGGHGCALSANYRPDGGFHFVALTGPKRQLAGGLGYYLAAPFGDMMLSGCFGLVAAVQARQASGQE